MKKKTPKSTGKGRRKTNKPVKHHTGKVGRPHEYLPENVIKILEEEFMIDSSVVDACHKAKITRERYYDEIAKSPDFAYRMRTSQLYVDRQARGSVVSAIAVKRNWKASMEWLKLRNRRYKPKANMDGSGKIVLELPSFPADHPFFKKDDAND